MNKPMKQLRSLFAAALLSLATSAWATAEMVVVVSASNPLEQVSQAQLVNIFLGRSSYFGEQRRATPVDQLEGNPIREEFYEQMLGWSAAQLKAHWSKVIFTGRGKPPRQLADDAAVKRRIAGDTTAIGYIHRRNIDPSVKIVDVAH